LSFPALTGQRITVTFDTVRLVDTVNYSTQSEQALPLGVAEIGIPGLHAAPLPAAIPSPCRDDLLAIDGQPISVSVSGSTQTALARVNPLNVTLCGPDAGGIPLGAGTHTLTSTYGDTMVNNQSTIGFDMDQVALDSAAGGGVGAAAPAGTIPAPPAQPNTNVTVTSHTATAMHLRVTGATTPFELVMGQSVNAGWVAKIDGVGSLGQPVLVDGFGNGWRVTGADLAKAGPSASFAVSLQWTPQTRVNIALIVSGLTILLCLLVAYLPERVRRRVSRSLRGLSRRLRRRPARVAAHARSAGPDVAAPTGAILAPRLWTPFRSGRPRTGWAMSIVVAVATGVVAALIARPLTGLIVGVATLIALLVPRLRVLLGLAAVGLMIAAGTYTVVEQAHVHAALTGSWASHYDAASNLAWAAVVFLGADAVTELVRRLASLRGDRGRPGRNGSPLEVAGPSGDPGTSGTAVGPRPEGAPADADQTRTDDFQPSAP
jgi:hypothetical protein